LKRFWSNDPNSVSSNAADEIYREERVARQFPLETDVHVNAVLYGVFMRIESLGGLAQLNVAHGEVVEVLRRELRLHRRNLCVVNLHELPDGHVRHLPARRQRLTNRNG
jgi:hypothetical protein